MPRVHQFAISLLLTLSAIALVWGIYSTSQPPEEPITPEPAAGEVAPEPADPDQQTTPVEIPPPLEDFAEMVDRPLFSQSRSPEEATVETTSPLPQPTGKSRLMVMGIIITQQEKIALLKQASTSDGDTLKVTEGQDVSGWKVDAITPESVTVSQRDTTDIIKLSDNVLSDAEKRRLAALAKASKGKSKAQKRKAAARRAPKTPPAARLPVKTPTSGRKTPVQTSAGKRRTTTK